MRGRTSGAAVPGAGSSTGGEPVDQDGGLRSPLRFRLLMGLVIGAGMVSMATAVPVVATRDIPSLWPLALAGGLFALGDICVLRIRFGHSQDRKSVV